MKKIKAFITEIRETYNLLKFIDLIELRNKIKEQEAREKQLNAEIQKKNQELLQERERQSAQLNIAFWHERIHKIPTRELSETQQRYAEIQLQQTALAIAEYIYKHSHRDIGNPQQIAMQIYAIAKQPGVEKYVNPTSN